jgi:hypothetical protein
VSRLLAWLLEDLQTSAAGKSIRLRGPGKAAYLFGDRLPSLTHSLRVSNARRAQARPNRYLATPTFGTSSERYSCSCHMAGLRLRLTGCGNGAFDAYE